MLKRDNFGVRVRLGTQKQTITGVVLSAIYNYTTFFIQLLLVGGSTQCLGLKAMYLISEEVLTKQLFDCCMYFRVQVEVAETRITTGSGPIISPTLQVQVEVAKTRIRIPTFWTLNP